MIEVVNYYSKQKDADAQTIETELYPAFSKTFAGFKLLLQGESRRVSPEPVVYLKAAYELKGDKTSCGFRRRKASTGNCSAAEARFDSVKFAGNL